MWAAQSFVNDWEPRIRSELERRVGDALNARVQIDSVSLGAIHRITLSNVSVWDRETPAHLVFHAPTIALTLSLLDLPHAVIKRRPLASIGLISIESPSIILSPERLNAFHTKRAPSVDKAPLLFTLAWNGGTFQWKDPRAPHGVWTVYQAEGAFRVRGPRTTLAVKGSVEQAQTVRFEFASLGKRWNARGYIRGGSFDGMLNLWRRMAPSGRQPPPQLSAHGLFNLEIQATGRQWPKTGDRYWNYIEGGRLMVRHAQVQWALPKSDTPVTVEADGQMVMRNRRISTSGFVLTSNGQRLILSGSAWPLMNPPRVDMHAGSKSFDLSALAAFARAPEAAHGKAEVHVTVNGPFADPEWVINATAPSGDFRGKPFQNAKLVVKIVHRRADIQSAVFEMMQGKIFVKGFAAAETSDLQITGENLAMSSVRVPTPWPSLMGRLNFSSRFTGKWKAWRATGSYGLNSFQWGAHAPEDLQGDFEADAEHFQVQALAKHSGFRLVARGMRDTEGLTLDKLEIHFPTGARLFGQARVETKDDSLEGEFSAQSVALPDDLPFLAPWTGQIKGHLFGHGHLSGTLGHPQVQAELTSDVLHYGSGDLGMAAATINWRKGSLEIPTMKLTPGLEGDLHYQEAPKRWTMRLALQSLDAAAAAAPLGLSNPVKGALSGKILIVHGDSWSGRGTLDWTNGSYGAISLNNATLSYLLSSHALDIKDIRIKAPLASVQLQGQLAWPENAAFPDTAKISFSGSAASPSKTWEAPLHAEGRVDSFRHSRGRLAISSSDVLIRQSRAGPFHTMFEWNGKAFTWGQTHWGSAWTSSGSFSPPEHAGEHGEWSARVDGKAVPLAQWAHWLFPRSTDAVNGLLNGSVTYKGIPGKGRFDVTAQVENGVWRAFHGTGDLHATMDEGQARLDPVDAHVTVAGGGELNFHGTLGLKDGMTDGALQISGLHLDPLGKSLSFPKPLAGSTDGKLTVSGPLNRLHLVGHLEGGPIRYGDAANAFKMERFVTNVVLKPSEQNSEIRRLVITDASFRTAEEQIRLMPGSFVDFAGSSSPAVIQVGTQVRNLHLGLFTLFGGLDFSGLWQVKPEGFALKGDAYTHSLYINDYELEEGRVTADYYAGVLTFKPPLRGPRLVTGTVDFHHVPQLKFKDFYISGKEDQDLQITGDVGPSLWNFRLAGRGLDMGTLAGLAGFPYPLSGSANLSVTGTGDVHHPRLDGVIDLRQGSALGLAFKTGSAAFVWHDARITFTKLSLSDPDRYTLVGAGVFPLMTKNAETARSNAGEKQDRTIDFSVRLQNSNLGFLQSLSSEVKRAQGSLEGLLQIKGTFEQPVLRGSLKISNGDVTGAHYFKRLKDFYASMDFEGDKLLVHELRGTSGDGQFRAQGSIAFSGFVPRAYDLRADVTTPKGLDVQVPELAIPESPLAKRFRFLTSASHGFVQGHVLFHGPAESPTFEGQATITNGHFTFPPSRKNPPPLALLEWFRRINWDVTLKFQDGAWFENELVEANLTGGLHISGPSDRLRVDGGMDITEGQISYLGVDFTIRQARFDMRPDATKSPVMNIPYVRGTADTQVQAVDTVTGQSAITNPANQLDINDTITLTIDYAPVDSIKPRLSSLSNPNLTQDKLLARVTQLDTDNLSPQERNYLYQQQMVRLIDTSIATPLARNILKRTGLVDTLRVSRVIDPTNAVPTDPVTGAPAQQSASTSLLANTKYTFEKNFSRLSLGYGVRFEQSTNPADIQQSRLDLINDVEMSYRWFRNVYLRGSFDLPTSNPSIQPDRRVTIEPQWRFGWWGNTNKDKIKSKPPPTPTPNP